MWELFDKLYAKAFENEHAVVMLINEVAAAFDVMDLVSIGRLARGLIVLHRDFLDDLDQVALHHRLPRPSKEVKCPNCDDPDCPGAWSALQAAVVNSPNPAALIIQFYK